MKVDTKLLLATQKKPHMQEANSASDCSRSWLLSTFYTDSLPASDQIPARPGSRAATNQF